ncbi:hypothetical protein KC357_g5510 [Hortaea werneckii]|nr:hypothetical protein KC357_g5510 [Hortaea werneckii]
MARIFALTAGAACLANTASAVSPPDKPLWYPDHDKGGWKHHGGGGWGGWGKPPKGHGPPGYPTATSAASPTGTAGGLPLVDSEALQASILEENLSEKALELQEAAYNTPNRNRVFSSPGHANTLDLITGYLDQYPDYFSYYRQPFIALYSQASGDLSVDGVNQSASVLEYSPSGDVSAPFVAVNNLGCEASDYPEEVDGAIALISRGECEFGLKSSLAGAAGAVAAVVYNNVEGTLGGGTLGEPPRPEGPYVPSLFTTLENGTAILNALDAGEVTGDLFVNSVIENRTTYNIIAQTVGGDQSNVLAVGGHSDSVFAGPGINDDGSGIIGILETALQLSSYSINNAVRFCFWSAEEFGLLGSEHYVTNLNASEVEKIRLYLNFDMIASPNYMFGIYDGDGSAFNLSGPPGSAQAEAFFEDWFASNGLNSVPTEFSGRSDYGPFLDAGIPAGGLFTGAEVEKTEEEAALFGGTAGVSFDPNYHQVGDNYTNLNFEAFVANTKAIAAAVAEYGTSFDSIPAGNSTTKVKRSPSGVKRRGSSHCNHDHPKELL